MSAHQSCSRDMIPKGYAFKTVRLSGTNPHSSSFALFDRSAITLHFLHPYVPRHSPAILKCWQGLSFALRDLCLYRQLNLAGHPPFRLVCLVRVMLCCAVLCDQCPLLAVLTLTKGRKRKKRCDDLSTCAQCRQLRQACIRSHPQQQTRSTSRRDSLCRLKSRPGDAQGIRPSAMSSPSHCSDQTASSLSSTSPGRPQSTLSTVPHTFTAKLPSCSLVALLEVFERFAHAYYMDAEHTMLHLSYPILLTSSVLLHTWISCSAGVLSVTNVEWQRTGLEHQNLAITKLHTALTSGEIAEDIIDAVLLLHVSEVSCAPPDIP